MIFLRLSCVGFALLFFSQAIAQDTKHVTLVTCPEEPAKNDPTIVIKKVVREGTSCKNAAVEVTITDTWLGFTGHIKSVLGVKPNPRAIPSTAPDVFQTHRPCRITYAQKGGFIEWLIPRDTNCKGREAGWYYRVYIGNEVCIRPGNVCIRVSQLDVDGWVHWYESLQVTYQDLHE